MDSAEDILITDGGDGIAVVTLNRPNKRNAIAFSMWRRLAVLFSEFVDREDVRVIILTGAGGHFSAGADISEFATVRSDVTSGRIYEAASEAATLAIRDCRKPTIAAISGYAVGGGCGLALACDFRVANATARMGITPARLGIVYGTLDTDLLLRQVGLANAKRVLYTGCHFGIEDCVAMGLVDFLASGDALSAARSLALEIAERAPQSVAGSKVVLEALARGSAKERHEEISGIIDRAMQSEDYKEGARAFLEKRKPAFTGR